MSDAKQRQIDSAFPAFPFVFQIGAGELDPNGQIAEVPQRFVCYGISTRAYFAAHAPAVPQDWFTPVMPARPTCPALPAYEGPWTRELIDRARQWLNDSAGADLIAFMPETITDDQRAAVAAFESALTEANAALKAWFVEREKQTCLQWPWAWADAVLAAGGDL